MELGLRDHGVLVTGAGGFLGGAIARAFAAEGARVAVHHRDERDAAGAAAVAAEIGGLTLAADLRDEAAADALVPKACAALGRLDACVANAGRFPPEDVGVRDMPLARWHDTLADNLTSTFLTARGYLRHVAEAGDGSLVLLSSAAGVFGDRGRADYAAAKGALATGMLLTLKNEAADCAPDARVNAVVPAWTATPARLAGVPPAVVAHTVATQARRRLGSPEDVAAAVVWLASPAAAHVTGHALHVTGGMEGRLLHPPEPEEDPRP